MWKKIIFFLYNFATYSLSKGITLNKANYFIYILLRGVPHERVLIMKLVHTFFWGKLFSNFDYNIYKNGTCINLIISTVFERNKKYLKVLLN